MKMSIVLLVFVLAASAQKPEPSPTPSFITTTSGALVFTNEPQWRIKIHTFTDDGVVMDFESPEGKTLTVKKDGTVSGDLPTTEASRAFWRELGNAYPYMCQLQREAEQRKAKQ